MRSSVLVLLWTGVAMAGTITVDPATAPTYPVGTFFEPGEVSQTTDPLGPFSGQSVQFRGWMNGGNQVGVDGNPCSNNDPCPVFRYDLSYPTATTIQSITFTGDAFNGNTFELLDPSNHVIASEQVSSGNVGHTVSYTLQTPGATGTNFVLAAADRSSYWTYVSNISIQTANTPEPATWLPVLAGLGALAVLRFTRVARAS